MQPRQYRPGDVLDDYCPRERRVTDHSIVAMVDEEIQRTRCVVCDAEHEFKHARVPARRKTPTAALFSQVLDTMDGAARRAAPPAGDAEAGPAATPDPTAPATMAAAPPAETDPAAAPRAETDDRPFRRSLIRAQLPRPEGQPPPTRAIPEFTMHQPVNARARRGGTQGRFRRRPGAGLDHGGPMRFGRDGRDAGPGHGGNGAGSTSGRRRRRKKH
jgi:hypothetical protein